MIRTVTRRAALVGLVNAAAIVPVIAAPAVVQAKSMVEEQSEPETKIARMIRVDLAKADAAVREAQEAVEWIVAEWRHLWPLAPEEILGFEDADRSRRRAERDLAGDYIYRDRAQLTKRLAAKFRKGGGMSCFEVYTSEEVARDLTHLRSIRVHGRTLRSHARNRARRAGYISKLETRLLLAREYEAVTRRVHDSSGIEGARARVTEAKEARRRLISAIMECPLEVAADLGTKASLYSANSGLLEDIIKPLGHVGNEHARQDCEWLLALIDDASAIGRVGAA